MLFRSGLIESRLKPLGFVCEYLNAGGVTNLWATLGSGAPLTVLAGHTDVVPPGPLESWTSDPFQPEIRDGILYGRGAADMKSSIAAMICAVERLLGSGTPLRGALAFLITSDEEGTAQFGTRHAVAVLADRGVRPDYSIVGEASSNDQLGDRIVIGRRGSLGCRLRVIGKQGHVAYPHKVDNPIHRLSAALAELSATRWDEGNEHFPPTSFQVSNFQAGTGADNVVPGNADAMFNFRFSTESTAASLQQRCEAIIGKHCPQFDCNWRLSGEPFLTRPGRLIDVARDVIRQRTGKTPKSFTGGGTSDARFISPWGAEVIELGPINDSIHKVDEHVKVDDLMPLSELYQNIILGLNSSSA